LSLEVLALADHLLPPTDGERNALSSVTMNEGVRKKKREKNVTHPLPPL
jgi:hypothetical protein